MSGTPMVAPTLVDKLLMIPMLGKTIAAALFRAVTFPITNTAKANKPLKDILFAALRTHLSTISVAQEQWLNTNSTTEASYLASAKKHGFQPDTDILDSGLKLHWLGPKNAEKTLLFFHGGGYALACTPGHIQWVFNLQQAWAKTANVNAVIVGYTLAPKGQYPKQLQEAAETLDHLLKKVNKKPSNIVIGGDSAGGNLTVALLSHLLHPHPDVTKITLQEPLATAILISPWVKFSADDDSFKRNATSDMLPPSALDRWVTLFRGSQPADEYNEPIRADAKWFSGLDRIVKDILIWGGDGEVLIDSILAFHKTLKVAHSKTELVVEKGAAHEDFIFDILLGYTEKAEGTKLVESWVAERL